MGWWGKNYVRGIDLTPKQQQDATYNFESDTVVSRVLRSAYVNFREYYAAVEWVNKVTGERRVWAAMDLVEIRHDDGRCMIWTKDMGENMHPFFYNCPAAILKLLTPTDDESANGWRQGCREKAAKRARLRVKPGDVVNFRSPYVGITQWFVDSVKGRQVTFSAGPYRGVCLKGWRDNAEVA